MSLASPNSGERKPGFLVILSLLITEWVGVVTGAIAIGTSIAQGAKVVKKRKQEKRQKDDEEEKKQKERDEFIDKMREREAFQKERDAFVDKLPDTLSSMTLAIAEFSSFGASLADIASTVKRLEGNQIEARELRRIQTDLDGVASYRCDANGRCYEVSPALCRMFGMSSDELLENNGAGWTGALEKPNEVWALWQDCVKNNLPYEATYRLKNGIDARSRAFPIPGVDGEVHSYYGIVYRDVRPGAVDND